MNLQETWAAFRRAERWLNICKAEGNMEDVQRARRELAEARRLHLEAVLQDASEREA